MVPYSKVINGMKRYINEEIISKMAGFPKIATEVVTNIAFEKSNDVFVELKNNTWVKMLKIVNEKDEVDVEILYRELKKQAQKAPLVLDIKMIGTLTLNEQDVDKLFNMIMGG
jgi:hypothetical protein